MLADGVTEIVDVPVPPCVAMVIAPLLLTVKVPGAVTTAFTVTATLVLTDSCADVPVTETV